MRFLRSQGRCSLVVLGNTGSGKSSLVNGLLSDPKAIAARSVIAVSKKPKSFTVDKSGVRFEIWDTPGLCDIHGKGHQYIEAMKQVIPEVNLVLLCIQIPDSCRFEEGHRMGIQLLYKEFGERLFANMVIVATRANQLGDNLLKDPQGQFCSRSEAVLSFERLIQATRSTLWKVLEEEGVHHAQDIPIIPAGIVNFTKEVQDPLLDGTPWYDNLWRAILDRGDDAATFSFMTLAKNDNRYVWSKGQNGNHNTANRRRSSGKKPSHDSDIPLTTQSSQHPAKHPVQESTAAESSLYFSREPVGETTWREISNSLANEPDSTSAAAQHEDTVVRQFVPEPEPHHYQKAAQYLTRQAAILQQSDGRDMCTTLTRAFAADATTEDVGHLLQETYTSS